jgi:hypothetical protein
MTHALHRFVFLVDFSSGECKEERVTRMEPTEVILHKSHTTIPHGVDIPAGSGAQRGFEKRSPEERSERDAERARHFVSKNVSGGCNIMRLVGRGRAGKVGTVARGKQSQTGMRFAEMTVEIKYELVKSHRRPRSCTLPPQSLPALQSARPSSPVSSTTTTTTTTTQNRQHVRQGAHLHHGQGTRRRASPVAYQSSSIDLLAI